MFTPTDTHLASLPHRHAVDSCCLQSFVFPDGETLSFIIPVAHPFLCTAHAHIYKLARTSICTHSDTHARAISHWEVSTILYYAGVSQPSATNGGEGCWWDFRLLLIITCNGCARKTPYTQHTHTAPYMYTCTHPQEQQSLKLSFPVHGNTRHAYFSGY